MCRMDYAYFTDKGDREHNEDYIGFSEAGDKKIFVLADGLGGHGKGEVASCLVVENVKSMLNDNNVKDEKFLDNCFVMSQQRENEDNLGCSVYRRYYGEIRTYRRFKTLCGKERQNTKKNDRSQRPANACLGG